ncbi:TPR-repeat-containing chaperone protein DNAJ, putative [Trypanosoma equiperdum]|uniref:TPR-repeat-containing chaperone protein DNAJ, putative n=4 Tax=Trypanozoon TaxID=39700 RepID=Q38BB1_TRYB2|nr:TPR repeat protein [Trypanosoma brucei gambiense DAL972]XP_822737.1 chaperone protein DnaJ [Trypanosoma brucei brucei TREU927]RHW68951.1 TPR-repeat-containing chaperone protein DNAJ [Trypanosoma brucei equiperdum]SCU71388.1 TPR-repeat-containing chaperone protein DNAJ, putative [Trypanosoma equiperdum]EAN77909.1 TPR-repeat-containing chaperone protein DNAJ, putative [Trypanosoma brucei brucei TREU927]CBH15510.1 TPR repeat protein [Trypanosoma brucei gambiense DAL972]|eukprot:XP_011777774.1 TPR repeat protein [Trypanosoma brucei gambiense DAL972]
MEPDDGVASWMELREEGNKAFKSEAYANAVKLYSEAIKLNSKEAALFSNRSAAYIKMKEYQKAVLDAEAAIANDKTFVKGYSRLHNALCHLGRFREATQKLKEALVVLEACGASPEDKKQIQELHRTAEEGQRGFEAGQRLLEERNFLAAERELVKAAQLFPDCAIVGIMLGESQASLYPERVIRSLTALSSAHADDTYYLYVRALASYYSGQSGLNNAQSILRHTIELDPDNRKATELLKKIRAVESQKTEGNAAFKEKRFTAAVNCYKAAIEVDPSNIRMTAVLRGNQAAAKMELKEYSSALLDCDFAIKNGAESAKLYARRSRIHEALENYDDALRDIQRAAEMDPSYNGEAQQMKISAKRAKRKDYYKILGLPQGESDDSSIKRAYKKGCLQWHPDKWAHATEEEKAHAEKMFKEVGEAFSILSDPQKKRLYDSGQLDDASSPGGTSDFPARQADIFQMMNMMFQGGCGEGGMPSGFSFTVDPRSRRQKQTFHYR